LLRPRTGSRKARAVQASAPALGNLDIAHAVIVAVVEVAAVRDAGLVGSFDERLEDIPGQALLLDPHFARAAVQPGEFWARIAVQVPAPTITMSYWASMPCLLMRCADGHLKRCGWPDFSSLRLRPSAKLGQDRGSEAEAECQTGFPADR
jgi:hypothetical protein